MSRPSGYARNANDWYVEPVEATTVLLKHLALPSGSKIWDPACGGGNVLKAARSLQYQADGSDVVDRGPGGHFVQRDFLKSDVWLPADWIISNPPYGVALEFTQRALTIAKAGVAMILRLEFLEGQKRMAFFQSSPLAEVLVFGPRLSMPPGEMLKEGHEPSGGTTAYAWFVWRVGFAGLPIIGWLDHRTEGRLI